jgi:hypothetical protein
LEKAQGTAESQFKNGVNVFNMQKFTTQPSPSSFLRVGYPNDGAGGAGQAARSQATACERLLGFMRGGAF